MIEFEWRKNYTYEYHITWNNNTEPYQVLYLHYRNVSPILQISLDKIISLSDESKTGIITIHPSNGNIFDKIPPELPYAEYVFELKKTSDPSDSCLDGCSRKLCNAPNIEVIMEEVPYNDDFSSLCIKSMYKIPCMFMELYFPAMPKERFSIPEMKRSSDTLYKTGCLIKSGSSKNIKILYGDNIAKYVHTTEV